MLSIKQAAQSAQKYLVDLFGDVPDIRLEEVDSSSDAWMITLSFLIDNSADEPLVYRAYRTEKIRQYKTFWIDKNTGEVTAMKIRNVQDA
jgi:hypothetical protein